MADNRCPNCGKGLAHGVFIDSDRAIELPCSCEPAPDALTLILLEMRAIRALLEGRSGQYIPKDMLDTIHEGEAIWPRIWPEPVGVDAVGRPEKPCFTPLDSKVLNAVAAAAGISLNRSLGFSLQFREPALVVAVVEYHVSTEAFAAAVDSIRAIPEGKAS